jgi:tetratricopeptide (TPR) repeat protein
MGTLNDALKKETFSAIVAAFDKFSHRYNEKIYAEWVSKTPQERALINERVKKVDLLLSKRAFIPGFYRYVLSQVMKNKRLQKHRKILLKAFLITMLNPSGVTIKQVVNQKNGQNRLSNEDQPPSYTRRNDQLIINERYQAAFFKQYNPQQTDERFVPTSSIFAKAIPPTTPFSKIVGEQYSTVMANSLSNDLAMSWLTSSATIQTIIPEVVEDIQLTREDCIRLIREELLTVQRALQKARKQYQKEQLTLRRSLCEFFLDEATEHSPVFFEFYFHFSSILAFEWFDSRRPKNRQSLLDRGFPLRFALDDMQKARSLLTIQKVSDQAVDCLLMNALQEYAFFEKSFGKFKECIESSGLAEVDLGITLENIGTVYRELKCYKKMRLFLKDALLHYQKSGDIYRIAVGFKNMGEADWYVGFREKASEYFRVAEENSSKLNDSLKRFGVLWNLAVASRRIGEVRLERYYLVKCLAVLPENETDKILTIAARLTALDNYP